MGDVSGLPVQTDIAPPPAANKVIAELKAAASAAKLRYISVASKQELKDRIMAAIELINHQPVVHTWSYMLNGAA